MKKLPDNVFSERTRHGKRVYYFRVGRGLRVRLPDDPTKADFADAVTTARASGISVHAPSPPRPNFEATNRRRIGLALERAIHAARKRASKKGVSFGINVQQILEMVEAQGCKCALTSIPFYMDCTALSKVHPYMPSIDRIEPQKGYTPENIRIVVYAINVMLLDWGTEIFNRVVSGFRYTRGTNSRTLRPALKGKCGPRPESHNEIN